MNEWMIEIWQGQVQQLKEIFIYLFLIYSCFVHLFLLLQLYKTLAPVFEKCALLVRLSCIFCLLCTVHMGEYERPSVDGEKIGHSSVTSRPFCHYLCRAITSGSCDLWLMQQPWSKTSQPSAGVAFSSLCKYSCVDFKTSYSLRKKKTACFEFFFLKMQSSPEIVLPQHIHKPQNSFLPPGSFHPLSSGGRRGGAHAERICPIHVLYLL